MPLVNPSGVARWMPGVLNDIAVTNQTFTVGRVLLLQFVVTRSCQLDGVAYTVGTTAAGNVIGGVVGPITRTSDAASAAPVVAQSASTAQGSTSNTQVLTWTAVTVPPGIYYAALEGSDATGTYMRMSNMPQATGLGWLYDRAGGYGALTDPTPTGLEATGALPALKVRVV